jgi:hypothetical protein
VLNDSGMKKTVKETPVMRLKEYIFRQFTDNILELQMPGRYNSSSPLYWLVSNTRLVHELEVMAVFSLKCVMTLYRMLLTMSRRRCTLR